MKLHLPTSLRAALLACVVCFAGSAYADGENTDTSTTSATYTAVMDLTSDLADRGIYAKSESGEVVALSSVAAGNLIIFNGIQTPTGTEPTSLYMPMANTTIAADVQIGAAADAEEGATNNSLVIVDGSGGKAYTFTGSVSGQGDWSLSGNTNGTKNQTYKFQGDVSGYTGTIDFSARAGSDVHFNHTGSGESVVNAAAVKVADVLAFQNSSRTYTVNGDVKAGTLQVATNTTINGVAEASTVSVTAGTVRANFRGDAMTKNSGGTMAINAASEIGALTVSGGIATVDAGATISSVSVASGTLKLKAGDQTAVGDITTKGAIVCNESNNTKVTHDGRIIIQNSAGSTTYATFTAKEGGAEYTNFYINGTADVRPTTGNMVVNNAELEVSGALLMLNNTINLTGSDVTVRGTGVLTSKSILQLGVLNVDAGGKLVISSGNSITYTKSISLQLNSDTFSYTAPVETASLMALSLDDEQKAAYATGFSTSALPGIMGVDSALTLSFDDTVSVAMGTDMIAFTLTGLTADSGNSFSMDNIALNSTEWTLDDVGTDTSGYAVLYLSRESTASVPEPTTATLSLLALAGLAARRRRR